MNPVELVSDFYAALFADTDRALLLASADYLDHGGDGRLRGPGALAAHVTGLMRTFPDISMSIEDCIADGDRVVTRVIARGTHRGEWMGIAPTGRIISLKGINVDRVENGLIAEHWGEADTIGMLMQMGVDPFAGRLA